MKDSELDAIEARATTATPGPWFWLGENGYVVDREDAPIFTDLGSNETWIISTGIQQRGKVSSGCVTVREADAAFIAAARTDVPALVQEVRRLRRERLDAGLTELARISQAMGELD